MSLPSTITKALRSKKLLISMGVVLLLLTLALLALPSIVQSQAQKLVREKSGHALTLGKPEINYFQLQVKLPNLSLSTPEQEKLVSFQELYVDLKGTALFKGVIELDAIRVDGLDLNLALLPNDELNWTALIKAFESKEPEPESDPPSLILDHLQISNAKLGVEDRRQQSVFKTTFEPLNIELKDLATRSDKSGVFELDAKTSFDAQFKLNAQIALKELNIKGDLSLKDLNLAKLDTLIAPLTPTGTPKGKVDLSTQFALQMPDGKPAVQISNAQLGLSDFRLSAKPSGKPDAGGPSPEITLNKLAVNSGNFDLTQLLLSLESIQLSGLELMDAQQSKPLALQSLQVKSIEVDLPSQHAKVGEVNIDAGQIMVKRDAGGAINLQALAQGWVPPESPKPVDTKPSDSKPSKPWTYEVARFNLNNLGLNYADDSIKPGFAVGLKNIQISSSGITQDLTRALPLQASLNIESGGKVEASGLITPADASTQLTLNVQDLGLKLANPFMADFVKLELVDGTASTQGKLTFTPSQTQYQGNFALANLRLNEQDQKGQKSSNKPFLVWKSLSAPQLTASPEGVRISRLDLTGLDTQLLIAKDKSTNISRLLVKQDNKQNQKDAKTATDSKNAKPEFAFAIDRFNITSSEMDFADESLILPFGTRIHTLNGMVTGISNKPGSRSLVKIKGEVDQFGEALADGQLNLLDPTGFMDLKVKFRNVEMTSLTPYSATFAGRKINSGKLSLNLEYNIQNQQLNSNNQVIIDKLSLGDRINSPDAISLPLDLAIALLEDSDGRIDLGLPVSGSLNDPQFSYGALVWKALGNLVSKVVTSPFRALGSMFGSGSEDLAAIAFDAGSKILSPPQRENLSKLGQALGKRPNLQLEISGTWAAEDKKAIQAQQLRRAVAIQMGEKLQAGEDPGPLALQSPNTQKALEALFEKRLGASELAALKEGTRKANPGQSKESIAGQAFSELNKLLRKPREVSGTELAALKGQSLHKVLADRLQNAEVVSAEQLKSLALARQNLTLNSLKAAGVAENRAVAGAPVETDQVGKEGVALKVEMRTNK
ncbi:MAG: DUF748 domain-containing protein [Limnobacter sp.]|nr:DUF748 domain-containing protein [Limnobacter sp.]